MTASYGRVKSLVIVNRAGRFIRRHDNNVVHVWRINKMLPFQMVHNRAFCVRTIVAQTALELLGAR